MSFLARCPQCGHNDQVPDEFSGKRVRCQPCGASILLVRGESGDVELGPPRFHGAYDNPATNPVREQGRPLGGLFVATLFVPFVSFAANYGMKGQSQDMIHAMGQFTFWTGLLVFIWGTIWFFAAVGRNNKTCLVFCILPIPLVQLIVSIYSLVKFWADTWRTLVVRLLGIATMAAPLLMGGLPLPFAK